jgi:hypothetical protein
MHYLPIAPPGDLDALLERLNVGLPAAPASPPAATAKKPMFGGAAKPAAVASGVSKPTPVASGVSKPAASAGVGAGGTVSAEKYAALEAKLALTQKILVEMADHLHNPSGELNQMLYQLKNMK